MITPDPPGEVESGLARAAWVNAYRGCIQKTDWDDGFISGLAVIASSAAQYVQIVRAATEHDGQPVAEELRETAREWRIIVREWMAEYLLLAHADVHGGELRPDGLDADIAALCDVPAVQ